RHQPMGRRQAKDFLDRSGVQFLAAVAESLERPLEQLEAHFLGQLITFDDGVAKHLLINAVRSGILIHGQGSFERSDATLKVVGVERHVGPSPPRALILCRPSACSAALELYSASVPSWARRSCKTGGPSGLPFGRPGFALLLRLVGRQELTAPAGSCSPSCTRSPPPTA